TATTCRRSRTGSGIRREQGSRLERHRQLLIGLDDDDLGAEELQLLDAGLANLGAVLPYSTGERDRVDAAHRGGVGPDVLAHAIRIERERTTTLFVAFARTTRDLAQVIGAGQSGHA